MRSTLAIAMLLAGCSNRSVSSFDGAPRTDLSTHNKSSTDGALNSACSLAPGAHGAGDFDVSPPDIDHPEATFTTDPSMIKLAVPIKKGVSVALSARRSSTNPVLPNRLQLSSPTKGWDVSLMHAWCNPMECRFDFYSSTVEPHDRLEGWIELEWPPGATETLFSNLSQLRVCVAGEDIPNASYHTGKKTLTVNVVARRPN